MVDIDKRAALYSATTLAYIGDAVYELEIRKALLRSGIHNIRTLHLETVKRVNAAAQAGVLKEIAPQLNTEEQQVVRRGRNAHQKHLPRAVSAATYAKSTAFEALIGYLYLRGEEDKISAITATAVNIVEGSEKKNA